MSDADAYPPVHSCTESRTVAEEAIVHKCVSQIYVRTFSSLFKARHFLDKKGKTEKARGLAERTGGKS